MQIDAQLIEQAALNFLQHSGASRLKRRQRLHAIMACPTFMKILREGIARGESGQMPWEHVGIGCAEIGIEIAIEMGKIAQEENNNHAV